MPRKCNPLKKQKVKDAILKGRNYKEALKDAGYSDSVAHKSSTNKVVEVCIEEIQQELKLSELTPQRILNDITFAIKLALKKNDLTNLRALIELKGKLIAAFTDKTHIQQDEATKHDKELFTRYGIGRE